MKTGAGKSTLKNILFAAMTLLLFFTLAEAGLRAAKFEFMPDDTPLVVMRDFQRDAYKTLYRFDPDTLWSPVPGALYEHEGGEEKRINSLGFRGPEILERKTPGSLRVVCLGDSSAFGLGVQQRFIYTVKLAEYLSEGLPGTKVEVVNAGVVGFTSAQALARFKRDALPLQPDVVVLSVGAINEVYRMKYSDAERIAMVQRGGRMKAVREALLKSRTAQLALWLVRKIEARKSAANGLAGAPSSKPRVSPAQFKNDLESFAALAQKYHFLLVVDSPHRKLKIDRQFPELSAYTSGLAAFANSRNLPFVNVHDYFRKVNNEKALFRDDFHPSPMGHDLIAKMLSYTILQEVRAGHVSGLKAAGK